MSKTNCTKWCYKFITLQQNLSKLAKNVCNKALSSLNGHKHEGPRKLYDLGASRELKQGGPLRLSDIAASREYKHGGPHKLTNPGASREH